MIMLLTRRDLFRVGFMAVGPTMLGRAGQPRAQESISNQNIRFVEYPDFPEAHSTWGSIGYSSTYKRIYIGVTNHRDRIGLFEYNTQSQTMRLKGFIDEMANLRRFQWQGKIHSQLVEGPDGCIYFSTDGGENREEYLMNHPHGYTGGFFMKWDPASEKLTSLGMGLQYESIKDINVDPIDGRLYGVSYPQAHFLVYKPETNNLRDLGRMGSDHVPRVLFSDWWGNVYYVDWRQRLVKYEREADRLLFARESLPAFPGTPGNQIITGITTYARDRSNNVIYLITYGAKMIAFYPEREGMGQVEDLGAVADAPQGEEWRPYCPNLAFGSNGRLYYFLGGHGMYAKPDTLLLMEFDPSGPSYRSILEFPLETISEVTGSDVRDDAGNLYFAGRRRDRRAQAQGESGTSRPFMIILNPEQEIR